MKNMKKETKIEIPEGYEIDLEKSNIADGSIVFKEIKTVLPKTWGEYFWSKEYGNPKINYRYFFRTQEESMMLQSMLQLFHLRDVYRQGWEPDWGNESQKKWCIRLYQGALDIEGYSSTSYFLSFQSKEIAKQFLENFREIIEKAKPLMS
jgi:hypothetical protein